MSELTARIEAAAQADVLLVASDYDGTMAPIVPDPAMAHPEPGSIHALAALALMPRTHAVIISGRPRDYLMTVIEPSSGVHLIGSHGVESDFLPPPPLTQPQRDLIARLTLELDDIARTDPGGGFLIEHKPYGVAFHYRNADPALAREALDRLAAGPAQLDGVHLRRGSMVVEFNVATGDKGRALLAVRKRTAATMTVFVGDDLTDEDAFAVLPPGDLTVKVGPGPTAARDRVADPAEVAEVLTRLAALRSRTQGNESRPLGDTESRHGEATRRSPGP